MAVVGACLIVMTAIDPLLRLLLFVIWSGDCINGLCRLRHGWREFDRIRLSTLGQVSIRRGGNAPVGVTLATGSLVTRRLAWLRLAGPDGSRSAELVLASRTNRLAWHRLQLIWRLSRESFGHPGAA